MNENTINNDVTMAGESERALLANRYRIIKQLGQGGMGSVWLAEDTQLDGKLFAIKMLPSILVSNKRAYAQLKSEALVAMKLVHPNIVQIRAFEENDGNPFLVMDYIDGETLDDWLGDGELGMGKGEEDIVRLLKPIAEAIDYAHTEGVVHRDIKPANVMIRKDGRPFIMDFGIAREIQETMTRVTGKMSSGTLMYMSPEQLNGDIPKKEQDIYSFAAMVYECIKGEPPFSRGNIEYQIMNKDPEPLTYGSSSVPASRPTIAESVMAGLAKKPEDRPKSCIVVLEGNINAIKSDGEDDDEDCFREPDCENVAVSEKREDDDEPQVKVVDQNKCDRHSILFRVVAILTIVFIGLIAVSVRFYGTVLKRQPIPVSQPIENQPLPTEPKPIGPTEVDVWDIKREAGVQKERIERIDDSDGFKARKNVLSDLYVKAVAYENAKNWGKAAVTFTNYVDGCKNLTDLDRDRISANTKKNGAEAAQTRAENENSVHYVTTSWNEARRIVGRAGAAFRMMKFSEAEDLYEKATIQFKACESEAKNCQEREKKDRIRRMKWRQEGESYTIEPDGLNLTMKWCPAGSFMMGSPASEAGRKGDEVLHNVTLTKGYWLGETEVTQGQWKRIMDNETVVDLARKGLYDDTACVWDGSKFVTLRELWKIEQDGDPMSRCGDLNDNIPVYNLSWYEAVEFCKRLTEFERSAGRIPDGYEYRLPTESEWEYACRAGTTAALPNGYDMVILGVSDAYSLDDIAWYSGNSSVGFSGRGVDTSNWKEKQYKGGFAFAREVKGKQPNNWGFFDMIGNVWEWCYDFNGWLSRVDVVDPIGPSVGTTRIIRGGAWDAKASYCRSAKRCAEHPNFRAYNTGFRVVLAPTYSEMKYPNAPVINVPKQNRFHENKRLAIEAFESKRYENAYRLFMASDLEDKEVQWYLGQMYSGGRGVMKNNVEAAKWYCKAAEQGHARAQFNLGFRYERGQGVAKDDSEAIKWFRKSAEQGFAWAQNYLGIKYQKGLGVSKDNLEAVKWHQKAAEQGIVNSQFNLGYMYVNGQGIERNYYEAEKWFRKAAEHNMFAAQNWLGWMYENGLGVTLDYKEAVSWYRKAADQNHANALYNLGRMYEHGRGVVMNLETAKMYYEKAADKKDANAQKALERLKQNNNIVVVPKPDPPQQPELIDRPYNLKYCDNCGHALWRLKKISPRCEKCGTILFQPKAPPKDTTGKDVEALGNLLRGIGGGL